MAATKHWSTDPLIRVVRAVFDSLPRQQEELARILRLKGTTISHAKKRPGAFQKHRKGIAEWLGVTPEQLAELEGAIDAPDFEQRIGRITEAKMGAGGPVRKNLQIVPLSKDAGLGGGRLAVIAMASPDDGALVCFQSPTGWQIGRYYRADDGVTVIQPSKRARHWPKGSAPHCHPLLMIGEKPDERKLI